MTQGIMRVGKKIKTNHVYILESTALNYVSHRYSGHVARMEQSRFTRQVLFSDLTAGKTSRGCHSLKIEGPTQNNTGRHWTSV